MIVDEGMCYFGGICISYMLGICLDCNCVCFFVFFSSGSLKYLPYLNLRVCVI